MEGKMEIGKITCAEEKMEGRTCKNKKGNKDLRKNIQTYRRMEAGREVTRNVLKQARKDGSWKNIQKWATEIKGRKNV